MQPLRNLAYRLLRRSEDFFKTDMVYLAKGGSWLLFGQFVSTIASFGVAIAFANLIPATTYGTYQFVLAIAGILSATTLSGLNTAAIRSVARRADGIITSSFKTKLKWGMFGSLLSLGLAGYYFFKDNNILALSFLIVSIFLPLFYSLGIYSSLLKGKRLFSIDVGYGIGSQILAAGAVLLALFITDNLLVILFVYFAIWSLVRLCIFKIVVTKFKENNNQDTADTSYGKHLSVMSAIGTIADNLDKLLIFHFLGAMEVAIYSFAITPVMQLKGFLKHIYTLALPKFSQRPKAELQTTLFKKSMTVFLFSVPLVLIYIVVAPFIYKIFFPAYLESIIFSQVFILTILFLALGSIPATALEAQMEVRRKYFLTFFAKISKIILMLALVIPYGIWGIIIGILVNHLFVSVLSLWLAKKP